MGILAEFATKINVVSTQVDISILVYYLGVIIIFTSDDPLSMPLCSLACPLLDAELCVLLHPLRLNEHCVGGCRFDHI